MSHIGTTDAADIAGVSKNTIIRAIRSGKLSASRDDAGAYQIDPAELARIYPDEMARHIAGEAAPMARDGAADDTGAPDANRHDTASHSAPNGHDDATHGTPASWRQIAQVEREKSEALQATVDDLRDRLDREQAERQRTSAQLSGLLTHQAKEQKRRRWWAW